MSIDDVVRVARDGERVASLASEAKAGVRAIASWVTDTVAQLAHCRENEQKAMACYGIDTGNRMLFPDIRKAIYLVCSGTLMHAAREAAGEVPPC